MPLRSDSFVGRSEELAFLHERAAELADGRASLIVISGDRGIGKSRLIDEFLSRHSSALHVARVRCSTALRDPADLLNAVCEALATVLRRDVPQALNAGPALAYIRNVLRTARTSARLILAIEDVQHASSEAVDVLEQIAAFDASMIVVTVTPSEAPPDVREALARLRSRLAYDVRLAALPAEAMRRMIRRLQPGRAILPHQVVTEIIHVADGNPLLAADLVRSAAENGAAALHVPLAMQLRARRMLDALDERSRSLALIASTLGVEFDPKVLSHVAGCTMAEMLDAMQNALLAGLVHETPSKRFAFMHPLLREALQREMAPSFAARYHRKAALWLQRSARSADAFKAVAEQWRGAGELQRAIEWEERAGDAAMENGDFAGAAAAFRNAGADATEAPISRRLLFKRADALRRSGLEHEALAAFSEYLSASDGDDIETIAHAMLHKMSLLRSAGEAEAAEELSREILALDLPAQSDVKAMALVQRAAQRWIAGRHDETRELLAAVERDYRLADDEARGQFYHQRAIVTYGTTGFDDAAPDFRRGIEAMERSRNGPLYVQHLCNFGNLAWLHAHNETSLEMLARAKDVARTVASETKIHFAVSSYARALMRVGKLSEARTVLEELGESDADLSELNALSSAVALLELGSLLADESLVERALDSDALSLAFQSGESQRILTVTSAFALYHWHAGEEETARELLHRAMASTQTVTWSYYFAVLVAQFGALSDIPRARQMLLPPYVMGDPRVIAPFLELFDAFVARRRGRSAAAASSGRKAAQGFAAIGWPYFEGQAREVAGDHADALRIYERIGDARDAAKLRASMRPPRRSGGHAVALTAREREVALLALEGLTTPRIAERLGIGVRTVEHHLQVLYGKFGIRSRWQLPHDL